MGLCHLYVTVFLQLLWTIPPLGFRRQRQRRRRPSELGLTLLVLTAEVLSAPPLSSTEPTCVCYTGTRKTRNIQRSAAACKITSHYRLTFIGVIFYWLSGNIQRPYTLLITLLHVNACDNTLELMYNSGSQPFLSDAPTQSCQMNSRNPLSVSPIMFLNCSNIYPLLSAKYFSLLILFYS